MSVETIIIPKADYDKLVQSQNLLQALEAAVVDNWEGYGGAVSEIYKEED